MSGPCTGPFLSPAERARLDAAHHRLASVGRGPGAGAAAGAPRPATDAGVVTPPAAPAPSKQVAA